MRASAWLAIVWERLWPLLVPAFITLCLYSTFSWAGGWRLLAQYTPAFVTITARFIFAAAFVASLLPARRLRLPARGELDRRIEEKSKLENRPITARSDKLALGGADAFSTALWAEHRRRMEARLDNLVAGTARPLAEKYDPYAIRAVAGLLAVAAFFYSTAPQGGSLYDILSIERKQVEARTRMDAWVTPPTYTRKPPIYLTAIGDQSAPETVTVPAGSQFFLRWIGDDTPTVRFTDTGNQAVEISEQASVDEKDGQAEFTFPLEKPGKVSLKVGDEVAANWHINTIEDTPPTIAFEELPSSALSGSLQLSYSVTDDYGVVSANGGFISLEASDPNARPLIDAPDLNLPLPRFRAKSGTSKINRDLTEHPWAGSRVRIRLTVEDDAGQTGSSEPFEMILPGRAFTKPLALALVEQRRMLALDAGKQRRVADLLDATRFAPEEFIESPSVVIALNVAYRQIVDARTDDHLRDSLDLLWDIALAVEFGDLSDLERRLRQAQEELSKALENGASSEKIDQLMKQLRQAMNDLMKSLAEEARRNPQSEDPFSPHDQSRTLTQQDLQRMMDQIENLAKSGSEDAARQMLSELQRMMDNLRAGRHQQQRRAEGNEMNQAIDKLGELMRRQQELMNETFRMQRQAPRSGGNENQDSSSRNRQNGNQQAPSSNQQQSQNGEQTAPRNGQSGEMTAQEFAEALKRLQQQQEALEQQLSELNKQLEELGLDPSKPLGDAQREMGQAGENLGKGDAGSAASDQGQALDALRQGAQSMMQQMAGDRQQGGRQSGRRGGEGAGERQSRSDPLGRNTGNDGLEGDSGVNIPDEIDAQLARKVLEAIRKRLAIPDNPVIERDYLERLLNSR